MVDRIERRSMTHKLLCGAVVILFQSVLMSPVVSQEKATTDEKKDGAYYVISGELVDDSGKPIANADIYKGLCSQSPRFEHQCQFVGFAKVTSGALGFEGAIGVDDLAEIKRLGGKLFDPIGKTNSEGHFAIKARKPTQMSSEKRRKRDSYFVTISGGAFLGKNGQCVCLSSEETGADGVVDLGNVTLVRPQRKVK
jgi:hypothetical protein